jgi:hypothetical protein
MKGSRTAFYRNGGPRPSRWSSGSGGGRLDAVAEVDNAKAIAVRVGEHNKVRVLGITVPIDSLSSNGHEAFRLDCLVGSVGHVQVQVKAGVILWWRFVVLEGKVDAGVAGRWCEHGRPAPEAVGAHLVAECQAPERCRPLDIPHSQRDDAQAQHRISLADKGLRSAVRPQTGFETQVAPLPRDRRCCGWLRHDLMT